MTYLNLPTIFGTARACLHSSLRPKPKKSCRSESRVLSEPPRPIVAAETTRMAMLFMDAKEPGNPIIVANDAFLDLTGYDREEVLGQCFNFLMAPGTDPDSLARIDIAFAG